MKFKTCPVVSAAVMMGLLIPGCVTNTPKFLVQAPVLKAQLDNGLRLVVVPDTTTPLVQVDVRYEVGANEDPTGKAGLAHVVEHMMFQHRFGSEAAPLDKRPSTFEILPQITTGYNAYTTWDKTHYYLQAPKEDLDVLLRLEAARLNTGCKQIPEDQFQREREVVRNEIRERTGTASGQMIYEVLRAVYPSGHPYHEMVGGDDTQLASITMDDVCAFMSNYYVPSRATVIVTGNVAKEHVGTLVRKYFGGIAPGAPAPRRVVEPVALAERTIRKEFDLERTIVNVMWALPARYTPEYENTSFMQYVLGEVAGNMAAKFGVCDLIQVNELGGYWAPTMMASFEIRKGRKVEECLDYVWKAARSTHRVFESGTYQSETIARSLAKQRFVSAMEPISQRAEFVADAVQFDDRTTFHSEENYFYKHLDRIDTLDAGRFKKYVKKTLRKDNALVFVAMSSATGRARDKRASLTFGGKSHERKNDPESNPDDAKRALTVPKSDSVLMRAERYELNNGMKIVLLPYQGLPIVHTNLVFGTGSIHEPVSMSGLAKVAASLESQASSKVEFAGVSRSGDSGMDHTIFQSRGINIYLEETIVGLERLVKVGSIQQGRIDALQKSAEAQFKRESVRREHAYDLILRQAIYGKKHPYATKGTPTPTTLGNMGADAAESFGDTHYSAKNATLIVAGNFDVEAAKGHIGSSFGSWPSGQKDESVVRRASERSNPEYVGVVGKKGMPQLQLTIAFPTPGGIDSQHASRLILVEMMRLRMAEVRTQLGSSYGVRVGYPVRVGPSSYQISGNVDAARAGETLAFLRSKLQELRDGVDFLRDFVAARRTVLRALLGKSTESFTLARRLADIARFDLSADFNDQLVRNVATATPEQVKGLIVSELDEQREIIVNMADQATLHAAFAEAGLDNVRTVHPLAEY